MIRAEQDLARTILAVCALLSGCALGCGGAPFSFPAGSVDPPDAQVGPVDARANAELEADAPDASDAQADEKAADVAADAAPLTDADPPADAAPDVPDACSPVVATPHDTCPLEPSSPNPFPDCYDRMSAPPPMGCPTINACETTPPACACKETFNCACLKSNGVVWKNCVDVGGAPWVF